MNERLIRPQDVTVMVKSLEELFTECDYVTPKMLAEKMSEKCGRKLHFQFAAFLTNTYGFNTSAFHRRANSPVMERHYFKDYDLLNKLKLDLPNIEATCLAYQDSPPSSALSFSRTKYDILGVSRDV